MGFPVEINFVAVLVASVLAFVIGALWYSPLLFANMWMKEMKMSKKDVEKAKKKGMAKQMIINFVTTVVMILMLAKIIGLTGWTSVMGALKIGFTLWLGFTAMPMVNEILWQNRSFKLYAINAGHMLVATLVAAVILGVMP